MTEEKKIEDKKKQPNPLAELPRGIPVALLRLGRPIQVPGRQSDDTLKSEKQPSGRTWEIEYIPQIRHFKVTYSDPERQKERLVHGATSSSRFHNRALPAPILSAGGP